MVEKTMDKIVALAKSRGFVYPGSEIYGGLANTWDYGNLGVELKNNVKKAWWKKFVQENPYNVGVDCAILMNPQTWVASGHLGGFSDPLMDCKECHERFRADKLIEDYCEEKGITLEGSVDGWSQEQMTAFIEEHQIPCPTCGKHNFTDIRQFNLMFKTFQGVTEDAKNTVIPGCDRGCEEYRVSPSGDGPGNLCKLQECTAYIQKETAVRHRADRKIIPERDHARKLHIPYKRVRADGTGILL